MNGPLRKISPNHLRVMPNSVDGLLPPCDIEAEKDVLAHALFDKADEMLQALKPNDFYDPKYQAIAEAIQALSAEGNWKSAGERADITNVVTWIKDNGRANLFPIQEGDICPIRYQIIDLVERRGLRPGFPRKLDTIKEKSKQRRLAWACEEIRAGLYAGMNSQTRELISDPAASRVFLEEAYQRISGIVAESATQLLSTPGERLQRMIATARARAGRKTVMTGFDKLDRMTGGFSPGEVWVIGARTGMGKTSLALQLGERAADGGDSAALFFSLEVEECKLTQKHLAGLAQIPFNRLSDLLAGKDRFTPIEHERLTEASRILDRCKMQVTDKPASIADIQAITKAARRNLEKEGKKLGLVIIDHIGLIHVDPNSREPRANQVAAVSKNLKFLSKSLDVPIVVLCQINRESAKASSREKRRPALTDLRESGSIEQDADVVVLIHREHYYDPEAPPEEAELILAKNRNGETGIAHVTWNGRATRFGEVGDEPELPEWHQGE